MSALLEASADGSRATAKDLGRACVDQQLANSYSITGARCKSSDASAAGLVRNAPNEVMK